MACAFADMALHYAPILVMAKSDSKALLTTQRNSLFLALQAKGLSPSDFDFGEDSDGGFVKYKGTRYGFLILPVQDEDYEDPYYRISASPGKELLQEDWKADDWGSVLGGFNYWLDCLNTQLNAPDLWASISGDTQLIRLEASQENQPFTLDEQLLVKKALNEIKAYLIKSHNLSDDRLRDIQSRLSYLEEAATRLGRKDWTGILISSLIGIVSTLSLSADSTRDLLRFAGQIVKQLLGTVLYLAGPH